VTGPDDSATAGIQVELTRNGLWLELRAPGGRWRRRFVSAPELHRFITTEGGLF